jgi:hypothetical protein
MKKKTGETIVSVTVQKQNVLSKYLCKLVYKFYVKRKVISQMDNV